MRDARGHLFPLQGTAWSDDGPPGTPRFRLIPRTPIGAVMTYLGEAGRPDNAKGGCGGSMMTES